MSIGLFEGGLAMQVIPAAFAAIAMTSRFERSIEPCSQSNNIQSKPNSATISTNCGELNIKDIPITGVPDTIVAFISGAFILRLLCLNFRFCIFTLQQVYDTLFLQSLGDIESGLKRVGI